MCPGAPEETGHAFSPRETPVSEQAMVGLFPLKQNTGSRPALPPLCPSREEFIWAQILLFIESFKNLVAITILFNIQAVPDKVQGSPFVAFVAAVLLRMSLVFGGRRFPGHSAPESGRETSLQGPSSVLLSEFRPEVHAWEPR